MVLDSAELDLETSDFQKRKVFRRGQGPVLQQQRGSGMRIPRAHKTQTLLIVKWETLRPNSAHTCAQIAWIRISGPTASTRPTIMAIITVVEGAMAIWEIRIVIQPTMVDRVDRVDRAVPQQFLRGCHDLPSYNNGVIRCMSAGRHKLSEGRKQRLQALPLKGVRQSLGQTRQPHVR